MSALTNRFKSTPKLEVIKGTKFKATDPEVMAKTIGREASQYHKLNPPKFEEAKIDFHQKGLFSLFGVKIFKSDKHNFKL